MTHEEFIQWLDTEIDVADQLAERENRKTEPYFGYEGRARALEEVKEKFLTIMPPPTTLN